MPSAYAKIVLMEVSARKLAALLATVIVILVFTLLVLPDTATEVCRYVGPHLDVVGYEAPGDTPGRCGGKNDNYTTKASPLADTLLGMVYGNSFVLIVGFLTLGVRSLFRMLYKYFHSAVLTDRNDLKQ